MSLMRKRERLSTYKRIITVLSRKSLLIITKKSKISRPLPSIKMISRNISSKTKNYQLILPISKNKTKKKQINWKKSNNSLLKPKWSIPSFINNLIGLDKVWYKC